MYPINFTLTKRKLCLSLHYNGANSYLFVNGEKIVKLEAKNSEIIATPIGNISKDWSADNMKKTELNGYVNEFSVDYRIFNPSIFDKTISDINIFNKRKFIERSFTECKFIELYFNE